MEFFDGFTNLKAHGMFERNVNGAKTPPRRRERDLKPAGHLKKKERKFDGLTSPKPTGCSNQENGSYGEPQLEKDGEADHVVEIVRAQMVTR